jgi:Phospholipase_D-nuclease N-terminal
VQPCTPLSPDPVSGGRSARPGRRSIDENGRAVADLKTDQILALLAPIIVIQLGLMLAALLDLEKDERRVRGGNKLVWVLVIVFVNVIGPIVYFLAGREEA